MNTNASKSGSGGWVLVCVGLAWLIGTVVIGFHHFSRWRTDVQLDAHGVATSAMLGSVIEIRGEKGSISYKVYYSFRPPGQPEQNGEVALSQDEAKGLHEQYPGNYSRDSRPGIARYLPEDPAQNRLEGVQTHSSSLLGFLFGLLFLGGFAGAGVALIVSGVRMSLPDPPLSTLPSKESPREPGHQVKLGSLTYISNPDRATFRPSILTFLGVLVVGGAFGLIMSYITLLAIAGAFNTMFGWEFPGFLTSDMSTGQTPALFGVAILGISFLPGIFAALLLAMMVHVIRFWRHPAVLDYTEGVFRCGGLEVCNLSEIRSVHLKRTTDPNYPNRTKIGLALMLNDGFLYRLEPHSAFLNRFGNQAKEPFTNLGELREGYQQEAVRRVATEVAGRLNVPLRESTEWQSFVSAGKGMGG